MTNATAWIILLFVLVLLVVLTERSRGPDRIRLIPTLARLLRRVGRWYWAAGEGLEHGYRHSQRVKQQISLDLGPQPSSTSAPGSGRDDG